MQLITLAAAAIVATVSASSDFNLNATCNENQPKVRIYNKCSYDVNLWSVLKGQGCPTGEGAVLKKYSGWYQENYRTDTSTGVSIKLSKTTDCKGPNGDNSAQLEYFIQSSGAYSANYLDVSYVDCQGNDCPTRQEGFYLKSGNQNGLYATAGDGSICPILSCNSQDSCDQVAYVNPDDIQTKSCDLQADLVFYMCGQNGSGDDSSSAQSSAAPASSQAKSSAVATSAPAPSSSAVTPSSSQQVVAAAVSSVAAAVSSAAAISSAAAVSSAAPVVSSAAAVTSAPVESQQPHIKTEVVYVTQYQYTHAKRHAHGHRHQHFRA